MSQIPDNKVIDKMENLLNVASDFTRLKILYCIQYESKTVSQIVSECQASQSLISHQLSILRKARLVRCHTFISERLTGEERLPVFSARNSFTKSMRRASENPRRQKSGQAHRGMPVGWSVWQYGIFRGRQDAWKGKNYGKDQGYGKCRRYQGTLCGRANCFW